MAEASLLVVMASGLWLVGIGLFMAVRPRRSLHLLGLMATSQRINLAEQGLRMLAGAALVVRAGSSKLPALFEIGGWILVVSSAILIVMPLRWHAAYARWWSRTLPAWAVRAAAPVSIAFGLGLIYAAL